MTIDSNILIAYLDGAPEVTEKMRIWREAGAAFILSTVVESEVLSYAKYTAADRREVEQFLEQNFLSVPFDRHLARIAAEIRRKHRIKLPDAAIAATAISTSTPIITRNIKDFRNIDRLQVITL